jgi:hypothetical protein
LSQHRHRRVSEKADVEAEATDLSQLAVEPRTTTLGSVSLKGEMSAHGMPSRKRVTLLISAITPSNTLPRKPSIGAATAEEPLRSAPNELAVPVKVFAFVARESREKVLIPMVFPV